MHVWLHVFASSNIGLKYILRLWLLPVLQAAAAQAVDMAR